MWVHEGYWKDDLPIGQGRSVNQAIYIGERNEFFKHGKGKITMPDGVTYEGDWVDDKREGEGVHTFTSNSTYVGSWKDDGMSGQGKFIDTVKELVYEG